MAATCASSTARSPTMWQPMTVPRRRSTISLQNPVGRPSMIGRGTASNRCVATITSLLWRADASVSPDGCVLGVGGAPDRADLGGKSGGGSEDGVGRREIALADRLVDHHYAAYDITGGEDMWRCRTELGVHPDVAALVELHSGGRQVEPGGVRDPADSDDRNGRLLDAVVGMDQTHPRGRARSARSPPHPPGRLCRKRGAPRRRLPRRRGRRSSGCAAPPRIA